MGIRVIQQHGSHSRKDIWWKMIVSIAILGLLGFIFSRYPAENGDGWYHQLELPYFAPPYWLPFVMWTLVYILMGCSVGIVWHHAVKSTGVRTLKLAKTRLVLFSIHLVFNLLFPLFLIGFHLPVISLIDIVILLLFIAVLIRYFYRIHPTASYLLLPYFFWILYATILNISIIVLN